MPDDLARPLLVGGERMKQEVPNLRGGHPKTHRFTYVEARARLLPQIERVRAESRDLGGRRTSELVMRATLWPDYLAASYFPTRLLEQTGLELVGSLPARKERVTRSRVIPDALTKTLFVAGTDEDIARLEALVASTPPAEDAEDPLWNDIRTLADLALPTASDVFRDRSAAEPGAERAPGAGAIMAAEGLLGAGGDSARIWECVLHRTADEEAALDLFAQRVAELGGTTDLRSRLDVGGLIYLAARLDAAAAVRVAELNPLRAVRPLPGIRPVYRPAFRATGGAAVEPPVDGQPLTEHRIAVFDGGVDPSCRITREAVRVFDLTPEPPDRDALEHGAVVTAAALFGYVREGGTLERPRFGIDHYRVWPPPAGEDVDPDLFWVLRQIRGAVAGEGYRVVVLCLAPDQEVDDLTPHPWTAVLDELAHDTGALFVVAAGNRGDLPPETGLHRVQVPADMANGLGVGAATTRLTDSSRWDRAEYSSYGPGRPGAIMQPLVLQFGGTDATPFVGISTHGARVRTQGTSFAAPLVGHAIAGALAAVGPERASASFLRALAVHVAQRARPHRPTHHGYGRTLERFDEVWNCAPNEVTLLYSDSLTRHTPVALPLPVPEGLPADTVLDIRCTAAFQARVAAHDPVDYSQACIEWSFRPHMARYTLRADGEDDRVIDVRDEELFEEMLAAGWNPGKAPVTSKLNEFSSEEERRLTDGKWETVFKAWAKPAVATLHQPRLEFRYLAREDGALVRGEAVPDLPFALLVTVSAPKDIPLYELVRQQFQVLTPLNIDVRLSV